MSKKTQVSVAIEYIELVQQIKALEDKKKKLQVILKGELEAAGGEIETSEGTVFTVEVNKPELSPVSVMKELKDQPKTLAGLISVSITNARKVLGEDFIARHTTETVTTKQIRIK
jgi:hypothetical protein